MKKSPISNTAVKRTVFINFGMKTLRTTIITIGICVFLYLTRTKIIGGLGGIVEAPKTRIDVRPVRVLPPF